MISIGAVITTFTLQNTTASAQSNVPVTFGQVFKAGDLPAAGAAVQLQAPDNSVVPCQLDVKATNDDGSVRHAILSAIVPALSASASVQYSIVRAASGPSGAVPVPADFAGLNATVLLTDNGTDIAGPNGGTVYTADAAALLAAGTYETWLSGPIVSEWIVRAPLKTAGGAVHPDLHARFAIRAYAGQARAKINYFVENTWGKPAATPTGGTPWESVSVAPRIYAFSLKAGATTVHTRAVNGYTRTRLTYNGNGVYDNNATGLPNDATAYTATITVDGVDKPISITGSAAQTFAQLRALFNTQLGGAATCVADEGMLGLRFKSATTGPGSTVTIAYGTLFPALAHTPPYRPIRGDEYIHYPGARWKKTFWWGDAPAVHIAYDKTHLMATRAAPNIDPTLTGSSAEIASMKAAMLVNGDIGQNGITKAYMGDVGYAPGIGILPAWTALWLVNQGADAKETMLKQADLMGSWPVHVRDYDTDMPLSFERWPYATFSPNAGDSYNPATGLNEKLPPYAIPSWIPANANIPDTAHHPDFNFVPYLVTGEHCYMEGMAFYQRYLGLNTNAHITLRGARKCLWQNDQPRGQGWSLRTTAHTAYLLPTTHPLRADVLYSLNANVDWYQANYVEPTGQYHNNFGFIYHGYGLAYTTAGGASTGGASWMDDFITSACGRAVELGFTQLLPLLAFKAKCPVGRLTSGAVFCWQAGALYNLQLKASTAATALHTTWAQVYAGSVAPSVAAAACGSQAMADALAATTEGTPATINTMTGYPGAIGGYPSNMQPAVAYCASLGITGGGDAWTVLDARAVKPDYNLGPQFAIVPYATPYSPDPIPDPLPTGETMAIADRVKDLTTTTGTGAFALAGTPPMNYRVFNNPEMPVGSVLPYACSHQTLNEWENGFGTLSAALVLQRTMVTSNHLGTTVPVNFSAGTKEVGCDLTAAFVGMFARADSPVTVVINDTATATLQIEEDGAAKRVTVDNFVEAIGVEAAALPAATAVSTADFLLMIQGGVEKRVPIDMVKAYAAPAATVPGAPTIGTAVAGVGYIDVAFTAPASNGGSAVLDYTATLSTAQTATGTTSPIRITAPAGTAATATVKARNAVGLSAASAASNSVTPLAAATAPAQMAAPVATAGALSASIAFVAPANGGAAITGYTVTASTGQTQGGTTSPIAIAMPANVAATFTMTATNSVGTSTASPASNSVTPTAAATVPAAPTIGTAVAGDGYIDVAFTRNSNGGSAVLDSTATLSTGQTATGASSPIRVTAPNGTAVTATVKDRNAVGSSASSAASNSVMPAAAGGTAYTIAGYAGNTVKSPIDASAATVHGSLKQILNSAQGTSASYSQYWDINATAGGAQPASAECGWSPSGAGVPASVTQAANAAGSSSVNGLVPMGKAAAFFNNANLWVATGSGTSTWDFYIKPSGGVAQLIGSATVTGA